MRLVYEHLLRVRDLDPLPSLCLGALVAGCRFLRRRRRGTATRHYFTVIFQDAVECIDQILIVICPFLCCLLDIVDILLQRVQALEQNIDHPGLYLESTVPDLRKYVLHIMGKRLHPLISHGPGHALQGVGSPENFIDRIHIFRILLQIHDLIAQILQMLL